ncbi:MAG: GYD domain-containing protein [Acidobacteria bacterium]|nr:GYD domain-containing protein [Acidobacteriota bacterium]
MPTYITLFRWTRKGGENVKESPSRVEKTKQTAKTFGVEVREVFVTMGRYDTIFVVDAPDEESYAKFALFLVSKGNVHSETLRAFTEDEFRRFLASLP